MNFGGNKGIGSSSTAKWLRRKGMRFVELVTLYFAD